MKRKIIKTLLSVSIIFLSLNSNCYAQEINNNIYDNENIITEVMSKLSDKEKEIIKDYDIKFDNNLSLNNNYNSNLDGYVLYNDKEIHIKNLNCKDDLDECNQEYVLLHEIGHIIDKHIDNKKYSDTEEFKKVLDNNYNKYHCIYSYFSIDPSRYTKDKLNGEFFADMFAYTKLNGLQDDYISKNCPEVVEYMKNIVL